MCIATIVVVLYAFPTDKLKFNCVCCGYSLHCLILARLCDFETRSHQLTTLSVAIETHLKLKETVQFTIQLSRTYSSKALPLNMLTRYFFCAKLFILVS